MWTGNIPQTGFFNAMHGGDGWLGMGLFHGWPWLLLVVLVALAVFSTLREHR